MTELLEIEEKILTLSKTDFDLFRIWFDKIDNQLWDKDFEKDVQTGKLDLLGKLALQSFKNGDFASL